MAMGESLVDPKFQHSDPPFQFGVDAQSNKSSDRDYTSVFTADKRWKQPRLPIKSLYTDCGPAMKQ